MTIKNREFATDTFEHTSMKKHTIRTFNDLSACTLPALVENPEVDKKYMIRGVEYIWIENRTLVWKNRRVCSAVRKKRKIIIAKAKHEFLHTKVWVNKNVQRRFDEWFNGHSHEVDYIRSNPINSCEVCIRKELLRDNPNTTAAAPQSSILYHTLPTHRYLGVKEDGTWSRLKRFLSYRTIQVFAMATTGDFELGKVSEDSSVQLDHWIWAL